MLTELLQLMLLPLEKLPIMLPVVRQWRLLLSRAAAALETIVMVSQCSETLLSTALVSTNGLAFCLSVMLRLNASVRSTLARLLISLEERDKHGHSSCSTWLSSHTFRRSSCSCQRGGGRAARSLKIMLKTVPAICRHSLSTCISIMTLIHAALFTSEALCSDFRSGDPTMKILHGCIR